MATCLACEIERPEPFRYCDACGTGAGPTGLLLCLVPSVATGLVIALGGYLASRLYQPPAVEPQGVDAIVAIMLGTTLPFFDVAFGFMGGWVAAVSLKRRTFKPAALVGAMVGVLYPASVLAVTALAGPDRLVRQPPLLGLAGGLALAGALLAVPAAGWLGRKTRLGWLKERVPGGPFVATGVTALLGIALAFLVYGVAIAVIIVVLAIVALILGFWILQLVVEDGAGRTYSVRRTTLFGRNFLQHHDAAGKVVGESHQRTGVLGGKYTEHEDAKGKIVGESRERVALLGGKYTEHEDASGKFVGESNAMKGILGGKYVEHRDADGKVVGESRVEKGIVEDRIVHTPKKG